MEQTHPDDKLIESLQHLPERKRITAENRFRQIREFENYLRQEIDVHRHGKKFLKTKALIDFCAFHELRQSTFCSHLHLFKIGGIQALVPRQGGRKGKSKHRKLLIRLIRENIEPGKGYKFIYRKIINFYNNRGITPPNYSALRRCIINHELSDIVTAKEIESSPAESLPEEETKENENPPKKPHLPFTVEPPDWIRFVDKKSFNIAFCKYCLIMPFLNPDLPFRKRVELKKELYNQEYHPLPGIRVKFTLTSLNSHILNVKEKGFNALIPKHCFRKTRRKNTVTVSLKVNMSDPLECLRTVTEVITETPSPYPERKKIALKFFKHCQSFLYGKKAKYKPVTLSRNLTESDLDKLRKYKKSINKSRRDKANAFLMAHDGYSLTEIAMAINRSVKTIMAWFKRFKEEGVEFIEIKVDRFKNNLELRERKKRIIKILHHSPSDYGINRTSWTLAALSKTYEKEHGKSLTRRAISLQLKTTGYTWRKARRVLTCHDPEYKPKAQKVLDTLRNLGPNDTFFFIDEAGPWRVKKYGGTSLTPAGAKNTYPELQKEKGKVTFIAALDALSNQIFWIFTKNKNTTSVIDIIRVLYLTYRNCSIINLTWDCASWHRSKELNEFIKELNRTPDGPEVKVVSLPKKAQFLNVIESVFSAMKKAVIYNSDYQSEREMQMAISRYFHERNENFMENPKRAGDKIWDKERFNMLDFESGLHKHV